MTLHLRRAYSVTLRGHITSLKPLTVLGPLHRLYAPARSRPSLFDWQEVTMGRKASARDVSFPCAVLAEHCKVEGVDMYGTAYDLEKAFESMSTEVGCALWVMHDRIGFPLELINLTKDFHIDLSVQFKVLGFLGKAIRYRDGLRGAPQGCPFL